jgi:allantoinase
MTEAVFRGRRVMTPEGVRAASVHVRGGRITSLGEYDDLPAGLAPVEAGEAFLLPGLVDTHVHVNEPGRAEWEGFASATRAAAAGGVTTLLDMPLNAIPATTTVAALDAKRAVARDRLAVDVGFIGGLVPDNLDQLRELHQAGVHAFKCFLVPSGVVEFPSVGEPELREALPILAELGALLMVHAELPGPIVRAAASLEGPPDRYDTWLGSRPPEAEVDAVRLLASLALEYEARIHIVHLSAAEALPNLISARRAGAWLTAETCPHYLTFAAEEVPDGATEFKCAPPIRDHENRDRLWEALGQGHLDAVVSDHSPCPPSMKASDSGSFVAAWGGVASLQLGLSAVWTGARARGIPLDRVIEWMSAGPAAVAGLGASKGAIAPGRDADLVFFRPDDVFQVDAARLRHRHAVTPYHGTRLAGVVEATFLRGVEVFRRGVADAPPAGRLLEAEAA